MVLLLFWLTSGLVRSSFDLNMYIFSWSNWTYRSLHRRPTRFRKFPSKMTAKSSAFILLVNNKTHQTFGCIRTKLQSSMRWFISKPRVLLLFFCVFLFLLTNFLLVPIQTSTARSTPKRPADSTRCASVSSDSCATTPSCAIWSADPTDPTRHEAIVRHRFPNRAKWWWPCSKRQFLSIQRWRVATQVC